MGNRRENDRHRTGKNWRLRRRRSLSNRTSNSSTMVAQNGSGSVDKSEVSTVCRATLDTIENDVTIRNQIIWLANSYRRPDAKTMHSLDDVVAQYGFATIKHLALLLARARHERSVP